MLILRRRWFFVTQTEHDSSFETNENTPRILTVKRMTEKLAEKIYILEFHWRKWLDYTSVWKSIFRVWLTRSVLEISVSFWWVKWSFLKNWISRVKNWFLEIPALQKNELINKPATAKVVRTAQSNHRTDSILFVEKTCISAKKLSRAVTGCFVQGF